MIDVLFNSSYKNLFEKNREGLIAAMEAKGYISRIILFLRKSLWTLGEKRKQWHNLKRQQRLDKKGNKLNILIGEVDLEKPKGEKEVSQ